MTTKKRRETVPPEMPEDTRRRFGAGRLVPSALEVRNMKDARLPDYEEWRDYRESKD